MPVCDSILTRNGTVTNALTISIIAGLTINDQNLTTQNKTLHCDRISAEIALNPAPLRLKIVFVNYKSLCAIASVT
jgi:hypothetical protein